ncbi:Protein CBG24956, partial [Caenorhabditis briggsae]
MRKKKEVKVPVINQKGYEMQAEFNVKLMNLLKKGQGSGNVDEVLEKALDLLKNRNQQLVLLDQNPEALKQVERWKALSELSGSSFSASDESRLFAMASLLSKEAPSSSRRQAPPRQFFRGADFGGRHSEIRRFSPAYPYQNGQLRRPQQDVNVGSNFEKRARVQCFSCKEFGHYAPECPNR